MGLRDLVIPEEVIETPGGNFSVHGLGIEDITVILRRHAAQLNVIFAAVSAGKENLDEGFIADMALNLVQTAPRIAADIIAVGAGEPDLAAVVAKLPFPVQFEAIEKIGHLTFSMSGGPKKVMEAVIRAMKGTTSLLADLKA